MATLAAICSNTGTEQPGPPPSSPWAARRLQHPRTLLTTSGLWVPQGSRAPKPALLWPTSTVRHGRACQAYLSPPPSPPRLRGLWRWPQTTFGQSTIAEVLNGPTSTLIEHYDGSGWSVVPSPNA